MAIDEEQRAKFFARNKREAKYSAYRIVLTLIENYFDEGQPYEEAADGGVPLADAERLNTELIAIQSMLKKRVKEP